MSTEADPDLELKGTPGFMSFAQPVFLPSAIPVLFFLLKIRGKIRHWSIEKRVAKEWGRGGGGLNPVLNTNFRNINTSLALETVFHASRIFKGKFKISPSLCKIYASHIYFGLNYASSRHPLPPFKNTECILREKNPL